MAADPLNAWEALFQRALELIDSVRYAGIRLEDWSFGGGTVLMRRHRHRFSKDIDIFVSDPQYLGYLTPRLNPHAEAVTRHYLEQAGFVKLYFPEGEIDFVASAPLTHEPYEEETIFGRSVKVETSAEIVAKKVWHRGDQFTARDMFDLAMVCDREPQALWRIKPILSDRRETIFARIEAHDGPLRETYAALHTLAYAPTYDECVALLRQAFS